MIFFVYLPNKNSGRNSPTTLTKSLRKYKVLRYKVLYKVFSPGLMLVYSIQNFPKSYYFFPPGTHTYVCVSGGGGVRNVSISGNFAYVLNEYFKEILLFWRVKEKRNLKHYVA